MNWDMYEEKWNKMLDSVLDIRKIIACSVIGFVLLEFAIFTKIYIAGEIGVFIIGAYFFLMIVTFLIGGFPIVLRDEIKGS